MDMTEDLQVLDVKITRLKTEYEQYFMRVRKREPLRLREEVEKIILRYSNAPITNTSLKFKYSSLVSRYIAYKQYWTRVLREIEEGTFRRRAEAGVALKPSAAREEVVEGAFQRPSTCGGLEEAYLRYVDTRTKCHEPTEGLTFDKFKKAVEEQKKKMEASGGAKDVEVRVYVKDGKTKISLIPR